MDVIVATARWCCGLAVLACRVVSGWVSDLFALIALSTSRTLCAFCRMRLCTLPCSRAHSGAEMIDAAPVVTADALHTQHEHARQIVEVGGHYVFIVKGNQTTLLRQLKALPWREAILAPVPAQGPALA
ncbi:hypothetical protein [Nonomuraea sp. NPDC005650]|uniref:hypothetical protein n=1 Tax=Nonomuraea sp. NPDC005650 TaxID=3157045 RepID=UPI0033BCAF62